MNTVLEIICILQMSGRQDIRVDQVARLAAQYDKFHVNIDKFDRDQISIQYKYI